jgi:leucyl aminopeptidase
VKNGQKGFSALMGKKQCFPEEEKDATPAHTAVREFHEETYHYFDKRNERNNNHQDKFKELLDVTQNTTKKIYVHSGNIMFYVVELSDLITAPPNAETMETLEEELCKIANDESVVSQDSKRDKESKLLL